VNRQPSKVTEVKKNTVFYSDDDVNIFAKQTNAKLFVHSFGNLTKLHTMSPHRHGLFSDSLSSHCHSVMQDFLKQPLAHF